MELRKSVLFFLCCLLSFTACSTIDDDLSDCPPDIPVPEEEEQEFETDYELRLVTNMMTQMETKLTTQTDLLLADALRQHLSTIFTDYAHDVDLSFYETAGDSVRLHHDQHIMDANQASYTLHLPMREYMHLATANIADNHQVSLTNDEHCHPAMLQQESGETVDSHTTGLFTARQEMNVMEGVNQTFNVHLYMANCAAVLVIDPQGHDDYQTKVYTTGFATGYNICDSTYVYADQAPLVRTDLVDDNGSGLLGFCSVSFPSKEPMRTVIETEEPFIAQEGETALWEFRIYVTQPDGEVTETVLFYKKPLRAGQLEILKAKMQDDGSVTTTATEVGVSVTLDWKEGGQHDISF